MRKVETIFVVHPDLREEAVQAVVAAAAALVRSTGGQVLSIDDWGNKKLAYPIEKLTRGRYFHFVSTVGTDTVHELERSLRISDRVFRYLTVRLEAEASEAEVAEAASAGLGVFEGVSPDFGSGGIEHLLREPQPEVEEEAEDEGEGEDREGREGREGRGDEENGEEERERRPAARASRAAEDEGRGERREGVSAGEPDPTEGGAS